MTTLPSTETGDTEMSMSPPCAEAGATAPNQPTMTKGATTSTRRGMSDGSPERAAEFPIGQNAPVIEIRGLTKRFGQVTAVDDLSFDVPPGVVTGFLGPNGSGKSTTMRMMVGLDRPDSGTVRFDGAPYASLDRPLRRVGTLLDAGNVHPSRRAEHHLLSLATSNGIPRTRVAEVLAMVGMTEVARKRVGGFSLGMLQRLGLAAAMLGDPEILILDEPANGLDPEGIQWLRQFLRHFAAQGRTVFVSSHLLSEMAQTADRLVVIGQGRLIEEGSVEEFVAAVTDSWVEVASPDAEQLARALRTSNPAAAIEVAGPGRLRCAAVTAAEVGEVAAREGIVLHELVPRTATLEEAFLEATRDAQAYRSGAPA